MMRCKHSLDVLTAGALKQVKLYSICGREQIVIVPFVGARV